MALLTNLFFTKQCCLLPCMSDFVSVQPLFHLMYNNMINTGLILWKSLESKNKTHKDVQRDGGEKIVFV